MPQVLRRQSRRDTGNARCGSRSNFSFLIADVAEMKSFRIAVLTCGFAALQALSPAVAQDSQSTEAAVQAAQYRASAAYRALQQVRHEARFAEQDYLNAQEALRAGHHSDTSKRAVEAGRRALDAAQAKVAAARATYEKEVDAVDRLHSRAVPSK
jgi:hypothetical protein